MSVTRNNKLPPTALAGLTRALALAGLLLLFLPLVSRAQEFAASPPPPAALKSEEDPGYFAVREASAALQDGVYFLDARIEYRLSSDARRALQSGVPLTIRVEVELLKPRRLWFDSEEAGLRQRYQLEWHALSERFTVQNLNSGDQSSFSTLLGALDSLGRIN
ncbi:MAG TPA: DUF4390 domain-containing protein, partial [Gammaproteobacteria bacterium]|nr:DUF4390 domain-containing protein [Gammaproteobacteria bacterium]